MLDTQKTNTKYVVTIRMYLKMTSMICRATMIRGRVQVGYCKGFPGHIAKPSEEVEQASKGEPLEAVLRSWHGTWRQQPPLNR